MLIVPFKIQKDGLVGITISSMKPLESYIGVLTEEKQNDILDRIRKHRELQKELESLKRRIIRYPKTRDMVREKIDPTEMEHWIKNLMMQFQRGYVSEDYIKEIISSAKKIRADLEKGGWFFHSIHIEPTKNLLDSIVESGYDAKIFKNEIIDYCSNLVLCHSKKYFKALLNVLEVENNPLTNEETMNHLRYLAQHTPEVFSKVMDYIIDDRLMQLSMSLNPPMDLRI